MSLGEKLKQKTQLFSGFLRTGCIQASAVNISDQNLQKITLNYDRNLFSVWRSYRIYKLETTKIILRDVYSVKNSSKKHNFFLGFFAPDAYKLQPSYISDQNLQKITLNYFQSGVLTMIETTKIILRDVPR
jgi:hypothetical protein